MAHDHSHQSGSHGRAFAIGVALNLGFVAVEAVYGIRAHSLALVADAGHNMSDVLGLVLAWGATILARRIPTARHTYGMRRFSVLAAVANAVLLLIAIGAIAWEAVQRLSHPSPVSARIVIWVAVVGIVINTATALLFMAGRKSDLNIKGAFLHMVADAGVSAGVVLAGLAIANTGWFWLDPAISLLIVIVILIGTWGLLRDSVNLAIDAVPEGVDLAIVQSYLTGLPGIVEVHDLHIWGLSTTEVALTVHLVKPDAKSEDALLADTCRELHDRFGIEHATLQVERERCAGCGLAPSEVT
ncbi:MAG TPA: cation diffusion facilitator family transporter [Gemmatimonadales bacterium]|nr:cation diffusion facilitator family transporter [Gemmatimonadales bacterium]